METIILTIARAALPLVSIIAIFLDRIGLSEAPELTQIGIGISIFLLLIWLALYFLFSIARISFRMIHQKTNSNSQPRLIPAPKLIPLYDVVCKINRTNDLDTNLDLVPGALTDIRVRAFNGDITLWGRVGSLTDPPMPIHKDFWISNQIDINWSASHGYVSQKIHDGVAPDQIFSDLQVDSSGLDKVVKKITVASSPAK